MTENEFILQDRIAKIQSVINEYGEEKFSISFSGGKDSCVLSKLVDISVPGNTIPRIYADTGIELKMVRDHVIEMSKGDPRVFMIKPTVPIKQMLEQEGYPFKSKRHARTVALYQKGGLEKHKSVRAYLGMEADRDWAPMNKCPKILRYQFTGECNLPISDKCCVNLKEKPLDKWKKEHGRPYSIIGVMRDEGGRRVNAGCMSFNRGKLTAFQPLVAVTKEWEDWFIEEYHVKIPALYYPPYNFERTGCKGCPFAMHLQNELDTLEKFFPAERKQCEAIWKPVYDEYRRLGYRLKR